MGIAGLGRFFELSLGLSAHKEVPGSSWFLRMNPSSGNLHPTEAYAVLPAWKGLPGGAGVYHYAPLIHGLEQRARWGGDVILGHDGFWVGLTSITWREAWKYGERAFRYCQHDVGHALGAIRFAAAVLGWRVRGLPACSDAALARLLGLDRAADFVDAEQETPELLVQVTAADVTASLPPDASASGVEWLGRANRLSGSWVDWPAIDDALEASARAIPQPGLPGDNCVIPWPRPTPPASITTAAQVIRQRRSAVEFDGVTSLSRAAFLSILDATLPRYDAPPFDVWPTLPRVHLVLFVHRVTGLDPGLYVWMRAAGVEEDLRRALRGDFEWASVAGVSPELPLRRLGRGDVRAFAREVSCGQDIAADSAFSLGMLARFEPELHARGAGVYRELFWEAGLIGQALYLAAEASGLRGTGIGCYLDDVLHRALGIEGRDWQSLYHFTIGGPVEDTRLRTAPPYAHLTRRDP
jgi:nitroreductase